MNRRDFIQALGGVVTASAVAPFLPIPALPFCPGDGSLFNPVANIAAQYKNGVFLWNVNDDRWVWHDMEPNA